MISFALHAATTLLHGGADPVTGPEYLAGVLGFLLAVAVLGSLAHVVVGRATTAGPGSAAARSVGADPPSVEDDER